MPIVPRFMLLSLVALAAAGCDDAANTAEAAPVNAPVPATVPPVENAATTGTNGSDAAAGDAFTATGTFTGFTQGDYLYANFDGLTGHEAENAPMVEKGELAAFLAAHKGKAMMVSIATTNRFMDPPGEKIDVVLLRSAKVGDLTAEAWWKGLSAAEQKTAQDAADTMAAASVER